MTYNLILFDCDGTLINSERLNCSAVVALLQDFGINDYDVDYGLTHFSGLRFSSILEGVVREKGITFPENMSQLYHEKIKSLSSQESRTIDGAVHMVESAKTYAEVCVVSNGERGNVLASLDHIGARHFFEDAFVFTGLMAKPKPAPDLFLLAARAKGICPSKTLVIEDSVAGVTAGVAAGMDVWGFCGTHHAPTSHTKALSQIGAKNVYHSMRDMVSDLHKVFA